MRSILRSAQGARLRPGTFALALLLSGSLLTSACVNRGGDGEEQGPGDTGGLPSPALGQTPISLPTLSTAPLPPEVPTTNAAAAASTSPSGGRGTSAVVLDTTTTPPEREASATASAASAQVIASLRDGADVTGPVYADLRAVSVERIGERVRVSVEVGGEVPTMLGAREVIGLGVDFARPNVVESDAQVFVDGGEGGWRAYLQTKEGFVAYPGTFGIGGNRLVFEVPADELPDPLPPVVSAFLDWSTKTPAPASSSDAVPDDGPLRPSP